MKHEQLFLAKEASLIKELSTLEDEFIQLRQYFHQHPELSRQEFNTSKKIAELLESWGITVDTSISETSVVGTLKKGNGHRKIGLRADIDALPIIETTNLPYQSKNTGVMHACGHDGHLSMLLYAAKYLSTADFDGEVTFIFQPDEEDSAGARTMINNGLFQKHPVDCVFGIHNNPGSPIGQILVTKGPQMAGTAELEIVIKGTGCHAAHPELGVDSIVVSSNIVLALQTVVSRNIAATDSIIITIGSIHGGSACNVIPGEVVLKGTIRYYDSILVEKVKARIQSLVKDIARGYQAEAIITINDGYIPTINHNHEADFILETAKSLFNEQSINTQKPPSMGAEDFGFMLKEKPGAYFYIGNGESTNTNNLHNSGYNFNDDNLIVGAAIWSKITLDYLK